MHKSLVLITAVLALFAGSACGQQKPSSDDITSTLTTWYQGLRPQAHGIKIQIIRVGDVGKGDFDAPGSQDFYWPVEFTASEIVAQIGPNEMRATQAHGVATLWKDKLGTWKIGKMEPLPMQSPTPPAR